LMISRLSFAANCVTGQTLLGRPYVTQNHSTFNRALMSRSCENVIGLIITMVAMLR
jgi:hypothetical protein